MRVTWVIFKWLKMAHIRAYPQGLVINYGEVGLQKGRGTSKVLPL